MESDVHIRLMVSRGLKPTPYQDPGTTLGMPLIVILPGVFSDWITARRLRSQLELSFHTGAC